VSPVSLLARPPAPPSRPPAETARLAAKGASLAAAIPKVPGSAEPERDRAVRLAADQEWAAELARNYEAGDPAVTGYGLLAWREVTRVEVPPHLRRDLVPGAGAPLGCYENALWFACAHADQPVTLVHGVVVQGGRLWWHSWCELDDGDAGTVYDPTCGLHFQRDGPGGYDDVLQPTALATFTAGQAATAAAISGTAGPWPLDERGERALLGAVGELAGRYADSHPGLVEWMLEMRARDSQFAGDFETLVSRDATALVDLLADLAGHPAKWRDHQPGTAPWAYRFVDKST